MERDEWEALVISWVISSIIGYLLTGTLYGIVLACLIITYPVLLITRIFKYSRKYGEKLSPFACFIYNEKGLLASFKANDWTIVKIHDIISEERIRAKKYDMDKKEFAKENSIIVLNYQQEYYKLLDEFLKQIIPNPDFTDDVNNPQSLGYVIRTTGKQNLIEQYMHLTKEQKTDIAETMRTILAINLGLTGTFKVYEIASLTNKVYIYWFAQAPPTEYATYRTKLRFHKWNIVPWISGFPVVEMWGKEETRFTQMIGNRELKIICAFPIQDERYRKEKFLNIKRYGLILEALGKYTEEILQSLHLIHTVDLLKSERDMALQKAEIYKRISDQATASVTEVSTLALTALSLVSKTLARPEVPEPLKREISKIIVEKESKIKKVGESLKELIMGHPEEARPKPPSGVPVTQTSEEEKKSSETP